MYCALDLLLQKSEFEKIHEKYSPDGMRQNQQAIHLIAKLIKTVQKESGVSCDARIMLDPTRKNGIYRADINAILLPYHPTWSGAMYYGCWRHEAAHAEQYAIIHGPDCLEKTFLQISRLLYPAESEDKDGYPKPEYLYNYLELQARAIEAKALREAIEYRQSHSPSTFGLNEQREYCHVIQNFMENTQKQHSIAQCQKYIKAQRTAILLTRDTEHVLPHTSRLSLLRLWNAHSQTKITNAFHEFENEYTALMQIYETLKHNVQNQEYTTLYELHMREQIGHEKHQEMHHTLQNLMPVLSTSELQQPLPADAICIRGTDNMQRFLEEYKELLDTFSVCEEFDTNSHESLYVVFATKDLTPNVQAQIEAIPSPYEPETLDLLDEIDATVELDEFSPEEL